jgi:protein-L-isoaspartate(D-aspartate) O-methyltransferase
VRKTAVFLFAAALVSILCAASTGAVRGDQVWTHEAYEKAMKESGRADVIDRTAFEKVTLRRDGYLKAVEDYLKKTLGRADETVLKAFAEVPREYFMFNFEKMKSLASFTYEIPAHPWAIGYGSYISNYLGQAYMTQVVEPKPTDVSLEIGTGSGFQSAILSRIVREAYTIEIITALGEKVDRIYAPIGYSNVHARVGDGYFGWPEVKGGFDIIMVTCAAPYVPPPLLEQLKKNGRMMIPIGQPYKKQFYYVFTKDESGKIHSRKDVQTYFIPMTGKVQGK